MKLAVLAWGSLIWDRRTLKVTADFAAVGPSLPIEFCRVSSDGRLTLVIDEAHGSRCTTYCALSAFDNLDVAIENLRIREGTSTANIGFINLVTGHCCETALRRHPKIVDEIRLWTRNCGYDGSIWTALETNFAQPEKANEPFTVDAAIRYLDGLDKVRFARSLHYIWNAPAEIRTPVRDAVKLKWTKNAGGPN
jgi:hypothetical protein